MNKTQLAVRSTSQSIPLIDRSRGRLRVPVELLSEALRQAAGQGLASPVASVRLETGGVMADGELDPMALALLRVIGSASLIVAIDVQLDADQSLTTIWATPSKAVVTTSLDPTMVDIAPVRFHRLPELLADVILLDRPAKAGDRPLAVPTTTLARLESSDDHGRAKALLAGCGFDDAEVGYVLAFGARSTRRWRISSTWATDNGQRTGELHGLDAGAAGQWLMELSGRQDPSGEMTFTPQGDGDTLRALRDVLPRRWVGAALNPHPSWPT